MDRQQSKRRGLVLSGGGALGAYQAGALMALYEHNLEFEVVSATSVGTLHALAWNIGSIVPQLDNHWMTHVAGLKPFVPGRALRGRNPFRFMDVLDSLFDLYRELYPPDEGRIEILINLARWDTRQITVFSNRDPSLSAEERESVCKASAVMPHLGFKPVLIKGQRFFDAGFIDNLPFQPLLGRGLDEIWMIPLLPRWSTPHVTRLTRGPIAPLTTFSRNPYLSSFLGLVDQMIRPPDISGGPERRIVVTPRSNMRAILQFHPYGGLTFSPRNIKRLLRRGYADGRRICHAYVEG